MLLPFNLSRMSPILRTHRASSVGGRVGYAGALPMGLALIGVVLPVLAAMGNSVEPSTTTKRIDDYVQVGNGADGRPCYQFHAKVLEKRRGRTGVCRATQPVLRLLSQGVEFLSVTGDWGENDSQGVFILYGNVMIASSDGRYTIRTRTLRVSSTVAPVLSVLLSTA